MSDRNDDFNFDDDDEFFGDEFRFDDEGGGDFGDEEFDAFDDSEFADFGDEFDDDLSSADEFDADDFAFNDEEPPEFGDEDFAEPSEEEGNNRFVIFGGLIVLIILIFAGALLYFALGLNETGPSDTDLTRTSIAQINATTLASATQAAETQIAQANATQTALAMPTNTPTPTNTSSPTPMPTTAEVDDVAGTETTIAQTEAAANIGATQTERAAPFATQTAIAAGTDGAITDPVVETTPTPDVPPITDIQQTATAIQSIFDATPTPEGDTTNGGGIIGAGTPRPPVTGGDPGTGSGTGPQGSLPDAGLFDDVVQGGPAMLFMTVIGLLGVIFVSRRVRRVNRKED